MGGASLVSFSPGTVGLTVILDHGTHASGIGTATGLEFKVTAQGTEGMVTLLQGPFDLAGTHGVADTDLQLSTLPASGGFSQYRQADDLPVAMELICRSFSYLCLFEM